MDLNDIRKEIDLIDDELSKLIKKRMEIVKKIAEIKKRTGFAVFDKKREEEILARVCTGENEEQLHKIFSVLLETSREIQSRFKY